MSNVFAYCSTIEQMVKGKRMGVLVGLVLLMVGGLSAYSGGPPDGYAGDPPQYLDCTVCHSSFPVNSGDGELSIQGLPVSYMPGDTYLLQVVLRDPGQNRWGFELTAITVQGLQAGTFAVLNNQVQISEQPGDLRDYVKQTASGTFFGDTIAHWSFLWIAPSVDVGPVQFFAAGNAANGNFNTAGDYIYTLSDTLTNIQEQTSFPHLPSVDFQVFPNPVVTMATVQIQGIPSSQPVELFLVRHNGSRVATLYRGTLPPGKHTVVWRPDPRWSSGLYFLVLATPQDRKTRPILLLKP